jgi:hypothetical protein
MKRRTRQDQRRENVGKRDTGGGVRGKRDISIDPPRNPQDQKSPTHPRTGNLSTIHVLLTTLERSPLVRSVRRMSGDKSILIVRLNEST